VQGRPPWFVRLLAGLIRGDGAEFLRGDLEEAWWRRDEAGGGARWLRDALLTLLAWWRPSAVRRRARLARGGTVRARRHGFALADVGQDFRLALRGLVRRPGFSLLVVGTLGLGVGATATIYSVVDAVVVRALPYSDAEGLVAEGNLVPDRAFVDGTSLQAIAGVSGPNVRDWRERTRTLAALEAV
jgi:hypothetical protein